MKRNPDNLKLPTNGLFEFGKVVMTEDIPKTINGWQLVELLTIHGQGGDDKNLNENMKALGAAEPIVSVFNVGGDEIVIRTEGNRKKTRIFLGKG